MADGSRWTGARVAGVLVAVAVVAGGACSGSGGEAGGPGVGAADWVAAELPEVPDGMLVCSVDEYSTTGRRVAYGSIAEGVGDNCEITITASTSLYGLSVDDAIELARENGVVPGVGAVTDIGGHPALVGPMTDEGRVYGYSAVWEQAPGLVITVEDARYGGGEPVATEESALAFAVEVVGMDRARWDDAVADFDASYEYSGPPEGSTERVLAEGEVDGRPWTLSAWVVPQPDPSLPSCLRLRHGGDDSGPGCATQWEVLDGTGFVAGWTRVDGVAPTVQAGTSSAPVTDGDAGLVPVDVETFSVDGGPWSVWVAVVPSGTCTVTVGGVQSPGASPTQLWLLPGDAGAAACAVT